MFTQLASRNDHMGSGTLRKADRYLSVPELAIAGTLKLKSTKLLTLPAATVWIAL